jgi:hypothetical protein
LLTESDLACIVCGRLFSDAEIASVTLQRSLRTDPILAQYDAEDALRWPLCEDHGVKHLETPETRKAFRPSYFDRQDPPEFAEVESVPESTRAFARRRLRIRSGKATQ